jgi:hypothetical protein
VHEPHQVRHQVARVRQERQVLQHLHHCTPCQPAQFSSALAPSRMHDDPTILLQANQAWGSSPNSTTNSTMQKRRFLVTSKYRHMVVLCETNVLSLIN